MKPFYNQVNYLYHLVMDNFPELPQEGNMASAFVLGGLGIYSVVSGLQWASEKIVPNFDKKILPLLEKGCIAGMIAVPLVYAFVDPEGAKNIITQHPTYTSGMLGVEVGSITRALQDLNKRKKLEDRIN